MIEPGPVHHKRLDSGIELAVLPLPGRRTTTYEIRIFAGMAVEPSDKLGLANLVGETLDKGTETRSAQAMSDAFDAIGAQQGIVSGRETLVLRCSCLPEHLEAALSLHAEMLRTPTFPDEVCTIAVDLAQQELTAQEDEPGELSRMHLAHHAYGDILGRHGLGTRETLGRIGRDDIVDYWKTNCAAGRMLVSAGGDVDPAAFEAATERLFGGFGNASDDGRSHFPIEFSPGQRHYDKELEQEHVLMCWPGVAMTDDERPVEDVLLAVLGGGMSSRLFTEVREKQGLVYWVGAWSEHPRGAGMIFMGASTTPVRCDQTFKSLLREVDRIAEDLTDDELERAKIGINARQVTHGDSTSARVYELGGDVFHYGRPISNSEKTDRIMRVTGDDVRRYLDGHRRDRLCVVTLGPRPLEGTTS